MIRNFVLAGVSALLGLNVLAVADEPAASQPSTQSTTQASATSEPTSQPSVAVDLLTPRGTLKVLETASMQGDAEVLKSLFATDTPQQKQVVGAWADNAAARAALGVAQVKKFHPDIDITARRASILQETSARIDGMVETVNGDDAGVGLPGRPPSAKLKRVDGKWLVPFTAAFGDHPDLGLSLQAFDIETGILKELTDGIDAGLFKDADEVSAAYQQRMRAAARATTRASTAPSTQP